MVTAFAPGRVNLMGDHTDHAGGLVLPMAIDLGTRVEGARGGEVVHLRSDHFADAAVVPLDVVEPASVEPAWVRYVAGVVAELRPSTGFDGSITTSLPIAAGLSSSAALEVSVALALGFDGTTTELARLCQRAEQGAVGVPCGVMDQLASAAGVDGHALRIDCTSLDVEAVAMPAGLEVLVVHSGEPRSLATSAYADRVSDCRRAERLVGPLRVATLDDLAGIDGIDVRRRARHVVTESARVDAMAAALRTGDRDAIAELMAASHASLRDDFEVSTPALDALVERLAATPGVIGARLTGAGFGGCAVALTEQGTRLELPQEHWWVKPSSGANRQQQG